MAQEAYLQRRAAIEDYFDRSAVKAWEQLTSTAPVGRIRTTCAKDATACARSC